MKPVVSGPLVIAAAVLLAAASASLIACGSGADPYTGTWLGPTLAPSPEPNTSRVQLTIRPASAGWWSITMGSNGTPSYAAKVGDELQLPNGTETFRVDGDKLTTTLSGLAGHPVIFTRQ